jgi:two-component system response regulator
MHDGRIGESRYSLLLLFLLGILVDSEPMSNDINILLVEDNYEHLRLTKYLLKQNNVPGQLFVVRDGQEAVDYLYQRDKFSDPVLSPRPNLVLLDLNIPRINGREVLKIMKSDEKLKDIPVVVVSSSERTEDVTYAHEAGAAAYISKSSGFEKLNEALATVYLYASRTPDSFQ